MDAAQPGDTIQVQGALTVSGTTIVNEDLTITGATGASVIQSSNAITFLMAAAGSGLTDLT